MLLPKNNKTLQVASTINVCLRCKGNAVFEQVTEIRLSNFSKVDVLCRQLSPALVPLEKINVWSNKFVLHVSLNSQISTTIVKKVWEKNVDLVLIYRVKPILGRRAKTMYVLMFLNGSSVSFPFCHFIGHFSHSSMSNSMTMPAKPQWK